MDIVGRYAILHPGVAFTCKRQVSGSWVSSHVSWGPGPAALGTSKCPPRGVALTCKQGGTLCAWPLPVLGACMPACGWCSRCLHPSPWGWPSPASGRCLVCMAAELSTTCTPLAAWTAFLQFGAISSLLGGCAAAGGGPCRLAHSGQRWQGGQHQVAPLSCILHEPDGPESDLLVTATGLLHCFASCQPIQKDTICRWQ